MTEKCYCDSLRGIDECCGPYLAGEARAPTAKALMRSRYSAYVTNNNAYLLRTWHPDTRPAELDLSAEAGSWFGLNVLESSESGDTGRVEFEAFYQQDDRLYTMHERSRFVREQGQWFYVDGDHLEQKPIKPVKVGRNDPCPCGSGKKFKRCCG